MKNLSIMIVTAMLLISGCKSENEKPVWWDGSSVSVKDFEGKTMAAMVWIRPSTPQQNFPGSYQIYKRFDDSDYETFLHCLSNPEEKSVVSGVTWSEFIFLSFLDGTNYLIGFSINKETVILPTGYSKKLYQLLESIKVSSTYDAKDDFELTIAPGVRAPSPEKRYQDDWIDPNMINKSK